MHSRRTPPAGSRQRTHQRSQLPTTVTRLSAPPTSSRGSAVDDSASQREEQQTPRHFRKKESIERSFPLEASSVFSCQGVSLLTAELWRDLLVHTGQQFAEAVDVQHGQRRSSNSDNNNKSSDARPTESSAADSDYVQRMGKAFSSLEALVEQMEETILGVRRTIDCVGGEEGLERYLSQPSSGRRGEANPEDTSAVMQLLMRERTESELNQGALLGRLKSAMEVEGKLRRELAEDFSIIEEFVQGYRRQKNKLEPPKAAEDSSEDLTSIAEVETVKHAYAVLDQKLQATLTSRQTLEATLQVEHVKSQLTALCEACVWDRRGIMQAEADTRELLWRYYRQVDRLHMQREQVKHWEGNSNVQDCAPKRKSAIIAPVDLSEHEDGDADRSMNASDNTEVGASVQPLVSAPENPPSRSSGAREIGKQGATASPEDDSSQTPWPWTDYNSAGAGTDVGTISPLVLYDQDVSRDVRTLLVQTRKNLQAAHEKQMLQLMERQDAERIVWQRRVDDSEREKTLLAHHAEKLSAKLREMNTIEVAVGVNGWESVVPGQHVFNNPHQQKAALERDRHDSNLPDDDRFRQASTSTVTHASEAADNGNRDSGDGFVWAETLDLDGGGDGDVSRRPVHADGKADAVSDASEDFDASFGGVSPYADLGRTEHETADEKEEAYRRAMRAARAAIRELQLRNDQLETRNRVLKRELDEVGAPVPCNLEGTPYDKGNAPPSHSHHHPHNGDPMTSGHSSKRRQHSSFSHLFSPEHLPPYPQQQRSRTGSTNEEVWCEADAEQDHTRVNPTIWIASSCGENPMIARNPPKDYRSSTQDESSFALPTIPFDDEDSEEQNYWNGRGKAQHRRTSQEGIDLYRSAPSTDSSFTARGSGGAERGTGAFSPPKAPTRTPSEA